MKPGQKKTAPPSQREKKIIPPTPLFSSPFVSGICAIILVSFLAFLPVLRAGFLWDDDAITDNALLRTPGGFVKIWTTPSLLTREAHYWPFLYSVFWIEYHIWDLHPFGYHLTNLLFHVVNVLLLWLILSSLNKEIALFAALLFAVHPVHVESVAWIIDLKDILSTAFYLGSFVLFMKFYSEGKKRHYVLSWALFILSLLCKSMAVTFPVALVLWLWWKNGKIRGKDIFRLLPFVIAAFLIALGDVRFAQGREQVRLGFSFIERCLIASRSVFFYMGKLLLPINLMTFYPRWAVDVKNISQYAYPLMLILILCGLFFFRSSFRAPFALFLFALVTLSPTLGFLDFYFMNHSFVADRFQYLAIAGLLILFAASLHFLFKRLGREKRFYHTGIRILTILILSLMTFRQSTYYRNNETLFQQNIKKNPAAWPAYNVIGVEMEKKGNMKEAEHYFRKSVEQNPGFVNALNNLGILLARDKKTGEALGLFKKALEINPDLAQTHMNIGLAYSLEKNYEKGIFHIKESIRLNPQYTSATYNLALILMEKGDLEEGTLYLKKTLALDPSQPEVCLKLGEAYNKLGKIRDAIGAYESALRLIPDLPIALSNLAIIYSSSKDPGIKDQDKAIALAERACRLNSYKSARFLMVLGTVYAENGRLEDSLKTLKTALERAESQKNEALSREIGEKIKVWEMKKNNKPNL